MPERLLKITYHDAPAGAAKKLNAYLRMPSNTLAVLRREIEMYLFQERQLPQREFRTYWIDFDSDEIEVVNQNDYEIFLTKCQNNMHLQIAAIRAEGTDAKRETAPAAPAEDDPSNFIIHDGVECDSCGTLPLIGFRYKCIQCPNFDLCQACESAHKHAQHLMVRMPTNNGPSVVDAWLSSPGASSHSHRRSGRRFRAQCPFAEGSDATAAGAAQAGGASDSHKESRRDRRHARRHGGGVFSQFVEMMMNLPESNATPSSAANQPTASAPAPPPTSNEAKEKEQSASSTGGQTAGSGVKPEGGAQSAEKSGESNEIPAPKSSVVTESAGTGNVEEPVAAPRCPKEQPKPQATTTTNGTPTTPTTPVISLENLAQMVNPEYMRAGIEILNNFSEMFAKMIDPSEAAAFGCTDTSMASTGSTVSDKSKSDVETAESQSKQPTAQTSTVESLESRESETLPGKPAVQVPVPAPTENNESEQRGRSESLDQDWQMIDNSAVPIANVSSSDALINLNTTNTATATTTTTTTTTTDAAESPVRDFTQLAEMLRQHVNEDLKREQATAHTQTSQVDTVSTSTSTPPVATNSTSTSTAGNPPAPEEKRQVPIYHSDERINAAIHSMMAMGFSNEGAWLTQLLESVEGNIPAALDIMHTSQSGRN